MARRRGSNIITLPEFQEHRNVFRDRAQAGSVLADMLPELTRSDAIIFGIPAGGVPVGAVVARKMGLPFDVAVVSKITLPWNTEAGYGAVAFDGTIRLNETLLARINLKKAEIEEGISRTREKVTRRVHALRGNRPFPDLTGRTTVLVDDGLASGFTMFTAIQALKNQGAKRIHVAVPTAHAGAVEAVAEEVDRIYCPNIRSGLQFAVAEAYANWYDVEESEVTELMKTVTA